MSQIRTVLQRTKSRYFFSVLLFRESAIFKGKNSTENGKLRNVSKQNGDYMKLKLNLRFYEYLFRPASLFATVQQSTYLYIQSVAASQGPRP